MKHMLTSTLALLAFAAIGTAADTIPAPLPNGETPMPTPTDSHDRRNIGPTLPAVPAPRPQVTQPAGRDANNQPGSTIPRLKPDGTVGGNGSGTPTDVRPDGRQVHPDGTLVAPDERRGKGQDQLPLPSPTPNTDAKGSQGNPLNGTTERPVPDTGKQDSKLKSDKMQRDDRQGTGTPGKSPVPTTPGDKNPVSGDR